MFDWLTGLWDKIIQSIIWQTVFSHLHIFDWMVVLLFVIGAIYGVKKGFWKLFFDLLRFLIVLVLTVEFFDDVSSVITRNVNFFPQEWAHASGFMIMGGASWFLTGYLIRAVRKMFTTKTSTAVRFFGGSLFGIIYMFLILTFISQIVLEAPLYRVRKYYEPEKTYSGHFLASAAPSIHSVITEPVKYLTDKVKQKAKK